MVYTITLTNPLASGHDGSWEFDLLMECVVGTLPADSTPSPQGNGPVPTQIVEAVADSSDGDCGGSDHDTDGGVGGPTG
ncbi:unnamed protein product, partial [Ectocarpus sp. 8 AP-2014]